MSTFRTVKLHRILVYIMVEAWDYIFFQVYKLYINHEPKCKAGTFGEDGVFI